MCSRTPAPAPDSLASCMKRCQKGWGLQESCAWEAENIAREEAVSRACLDTPSVVLSAGAALEKGKAVVPGILAHRKGLKCCAIAGNKWRYCVYGLPQGLVLWRRDLLGRRLDDCCACMTIDTNHNRHNQHGYASVQCSVHLCFNNKPLRDSSCKMPCSASPWETLETSCQHIQFAQIYICPGH